jgi:hypothetical protein
MTHVITEQLQSTTLYLSTCGNLLVTAGFHVVISEQLGGSSQNLCAHWIRIFFFLYFYYCIIVALRVHCDIYKSSYSIS